MEREVWLIAADAPPASSLAGKLDDGGQKRENDDDDDDFVNVVMDVRNDLTEKITAEHGG